VEVTVDLGTREHRDVEGLGRNREEERLLASDERLEGAALGGAVHPSPGRLDAPLLARRRTSPRSMKVSPTKKF
jgi:hypothetical protein